MTTECCTPDRPHLVVPYDEGAHWIARRAKRLVSGIVVWERTPAEEVADTSIAPGDGSNGHHDGGAAEATSEDLLHG